MATDDHTFCISSQLDILRSVMDDSGKDHEWNLGHYRYTMSGLAAGVTLVVVSSLCLWRCLRRSTSSHKSTASSTSASNCPTNNNNSNSSSSSESSLVRSSESSHVAFFTRILQSLQRRPNNQLAERRSGAGRYWLVTSSLTLLGQFLHLLRCTFAAAVARSRSNQLCVSDQRHDDVTSGSSTAAIGGESSCICEDSGLLQQTQCLAGTCTEAVASQTPGCDDTPTCADMMSQASANDVTRTCPDVMNDVSMTQQRSDVDVTSYSLLSASDVSQLLPPDSSCIDEAEEDETDQRRLSLEVREIRRDLADIRACARLVGTRCHDDRWRRGDALTLGVVEALSPRTLTTLHRIPHSAWASESAIADWRIDDLNTTTPPDDDDDQSQFDYDEPRDNWKLSLTRPVPAEVTKQSRRDYCESRDRRLSSLTCAEPPIMTSSPAEWENNMADIYIDDELDDVIA